MLDRTAASTLPPNWKRWWATFLGLFLVALIAVMLQGRPRIGLADVAVPLLTAWLITSGSYITSKGTRAAFWSARLTIGWILFIGLILSVARVLGSR